MIRINYKNYNYNSDINLKLLVICLAKFLNEKYIIKITE
jgi:hypothetical protein